MAKQADAGPACLSTVAAWVGRGWGWGLCHLSTVLSTLALLLCDIATLGLKGVAGFVDGASPLGTIRCYGGPVVGIDVTFGEGLFERVLEPLLWGTNVAVA